MALTILNLFGCNRHKSSNQTIPELSLETLLQKSAEDSSLRHDFYKKLLTENLIVITEKTNTAEGKTTLQKDTQVNIVTLKDGKIPIFTSKERIFDNGVVKEQVEYLEMKSKILFEITKGSTLILNPFSDYGKEFLPVEIEGILNGSILKYQDKEITLKEKTPVQIGQPAVYPTEMINALKSFFASKSSINAAYVGWIHYSNSDDPPHYIFGIDGDGDINEIKKEAGKLVKGFLISGEFVDFIEIDKESPISQYFLEDTNPFYKNENYR